MSRANFLIFISMTWKSFQYLSHSLMQSKYRVRFIWIYNITVENLTVSILLLDINECDIFSPCHTNGICTDNDGSFTCHCRPGFTGDGFVCIGM